MKCAKCHQSILFTSKHPLSSSSTNIFPKNANDSFIFLPLMPPKMMPSTSLKESAILVSNASTVVATESILEAYSRGDQTIEYPTCRHCVNRMISILESEMNQIRDEKRVYSNLLKNHHHGTSTTDNNITTTNNVDILDVQIESLKAQMSSIMDERRLIQLETQRIAEQEAQLCQVEQDVWEEINNLQLTIEEFSEDRDVAIATVRTAYSDSAPIRQGNIYNESFYIWHQGSFGTINGFRMGSLKSQEVEWNEINAAWGEAALLLLTLKDNVISIINATSSSVAKPINTIFSKYQIIPLGTFSKVKRLKKPVMYYSLHGSDQSNFIESSFNLGICAWLSCLAELGSYLESRDSSMKLPYSMEEDKIGGISIRFLKSNEDGWTKASKFALTNLKWILAWCFKKRIKN